MSNRRFRVNVSFSIICLVCLLLYLLTEFRPNFSVQRFDLSGVCGEIRSIDDLVSMMRELRSLEGGREIAINCRRAGKALEALFDMTLSDPSTSRSMMLSDGMAKMVREKWLLGDESLYSEFLRPKVLTVTNLWTLETTGINPLRALKPRPASSRGSDGLAQALKVINASRPGCNFCDSRLTASDSFGRIRHGTVYSAENAFRYHDFVGLFIPESHHNFMEIDRNTFRDLFKEVAVGWFKAAHESSPEHTHPMMVWDVMPHAGASQVHPHVGGILGRGQYLGKMLRIQKAIESFAVHQTGSTRSYLRHYVDVHLALGLGVKYGSASVIVPLDSQKDHEFVLVGHSEDLEDWIQALYLIHRTFVEELRIYCFSSAMAWPPSIISPSLSGPSMMYAVVSSRGDCNSVAGDVSSLELFLMNSLSTDPFKTISAFNTTLKKHAFNV